MTTITRPVFDDPLLLADPATGAWSDPFVLLGVVLAGLTATLLAIGAAIAKGIPEGLSSDPIPDDEIEPEPFAAMHELLGLGFERLGPAFVCRTQQPVTVIPMVHPQARVHAAVYGFRHPLPRSACDFITLFANGTGSVTTASVPEAGTLPFPPEAFVQIVQGEASLRFRAHADALAVAARHGHTGAELAADQAEFVAHMRTTLRRQRRAFVRSPLASTVRALWRAFTRRNPHLAPLADQPAAVRQLHRTGPGRAAPADVAGDYAPAR